MPWLFESLLFATPFALWFIWWRKHPGGEPTTQLLAVAVLGVGLAIAGAIAYGLHRSLEPGTVYIAPHMAPDGHIEPGHAERRR
ncbi:hypothetical protein ACQW02_07750 [Humitalea sp. 24SJ18S-53]|uniref:hypothetical protein n=1 Tax=Humitalea sp. 24SJ18S-53 TaxID=3422307 RepID=UPI003D675FD0